MEGREWQAALARYAERLHDLAGGAHHVASPLGAWLVVALCSTLADDEATRRGLTEILGADPDEAAAAACELLADLHPLVGAGAGLWLRHGAASTRIERWRASLPASVDTGDIPPQKELDAWVDHRTKGLVTRFPVKLTPDAVALLASALATKVSWEVPFALVEAAQLAPSPWADHLGSVLRAPRHDPRHRQYLYDTDQAGTVAVHLASARGGLLVGSVVAEDPTVPAHDVLGVAHEVVTAEATAPGAVIGRSLFDLPLGEGPTWAIAEDRVETAAPHGREEHVVSVLPAWAAQTDLDLDHPTTGFPAAGVALAAALRLAPGHYAARQVATATYDAVGFEAAAVTALAIHVSRPSTRPGLRRVATVRFGHPFAVVAVAVADPLARQPGATAGTPWHGLPVFSAWVSEPADAGPAPTSAS